MIFRIAVVVACALATTAYADDETAGRMFRDALEDAARGDPTAIDQLEHLGRDRPTTRWTDDAWAEAARLAEGAGDLARARAALDQVIAIGSDDQLVRRATAARARLAAATGDGAWDDVAREHDRLVASAFGGDDPRAELEALERLVQDHPTYPRVNQVRAAIARGWEIEASGSRALVWYRAAADAEPGGRSHLELVRAALRLGELELAATELSALQRSRARAVTDYDLTLARRELGRARDRRTTRIASWCILAAIVAAALARLRWLERSLGAALRRLVRPPTEATYLVPLAVLLVVVAYQGNPLVARAVRDIAIAGVGLAWLSASVLDATRARRGSIVARPLVVHILALLIAIAAAVYLAVDRDRLLDLIGETWRGGPGLH